MLICIFGVDSPAVGFDDGADDGETEAAAAGGDLARGIGAIEAVEDARQGRGGDALAGIGNGNFEHIAARLSIDGDGTTGWGVAQRVIAEIGEDPFEHVLIGPGGWQIVGNGVAWLYIGALKF